MNEHTQGRGPLPRPQIERLDLPEEDHMAYWLLMIREFDWTVSRVQSKLLYHNKPAPRPMEERPHE